MPRFFSVTSVTVASHKAMEVKTNKTKTKIMGGTKWLVLKLSSVRWSAERLFFGEKEAKKGVLLFIAFECC